ncbi:hypothetical protein BCR33DRAFT_193276 [Rhizoclosmatium globosum]|uniref:Uncharacterized protein n=1 Tax=Rhizoclosmatium globosum TaxID=329046 RepID=A0A1Y2CDU6_9FUNG|nr:hypothetical protein BCR33DRAFT_193276 [Rhizoclosmatium globosum]|eukprot:ORY45096.1 hypothetical protein BCR33DRAFT_193276 [Rhizoclosmatium globosum]
MISLHFSITCHGAQTIITGFFIGLAAERAITSLFTLWFRNLRAPKQTGLFTTETLSFSPVYHPSWYSSIYHAFFTCYSCFGAFLLIKEIVSFSKVLNITSHVFYCSFNYFLLLKTYMVTRQNSVAAYILVIAFLHRLCWTLMDIVSSKGQWVNHDCIYDQNTLSAIGYNAADILIDVICTGLSVAYSWEFLGSDFTRIGEIIVRENVLRSLMILSVNSFEIYAVCTFTDPFALNIAFSIQNYVYPFALNAELLWLGIRQHSMNTSAGSKNHASAAIKKSLSQLNQSAEESQKVSLVRQLSKNPRVSPNSVSINMPSTWSQ